jgi:LacI family transcriptional regulator
MMKKTVARNKLPTMYDVARLAGVSQPTVSRVLNQNDTAVAISDDTRQRVLAAIQELGYRPNVLARSLRTQKTQTVALLIADLANGFYHSLARAVQDVARQHDYEVFIANSDHLYENERHFCETVSRRSVDGVIMVPIHLTTEELSVFIAETHTPVAVLAEQIHHDQIDVVYIDDERATYEATRWLIDERGYKSLGFIGVEENLPPGPRRFRGFSRALAESGLTLDPRFNIKGDFTRENGEEIARTLIAGGDLPRALVIVNDLMAIGVMLTLQEAGYNIPNDVAIIGFDNISEAIIVRPALTTIAQYPRSIGQKLAELLFSRIEDPSLARRVHMDSFKLIVRDSA